MITHSLYRRSPRAPGLEVSNSHGSLIIPWKSGAEVGTRILSSRKKKEICKKNGGKKELFLASFLGAQGDNFEGAWCPEQSRLPPTTSGTGRSFKRYLSFCINWPLWGCTWFCLSPEATGLFSTPGIGQRVSGLADRKGAGLPVLGLGRKQSVLESGAPPDPPPHTLHSTLLEWEGASEKLITGSHEALQRKCVPQRGPSVEKGTGRKIHTSESLSVLIKFLIKATSGKKDLFGLTVWKYSLP